MAGGQRASVGNGKGYYVEPTIFDGVSNTMTIAREEIFGPVLSVIPSSRWRKVSRRATPPATAWRRGWTRDVGKALRAAKAIRAGTVWVNAYNLFDAALPFLQDLASAGRWGRSASTGTPRSVVWVDLA